MTIFVSSIFSTVSSLAVLIGLLEYVTTIYHFVAGIGSPCSDLVECDHGSSCVMGHCACVAPLIQHNDVCVLMQEHKEVVSPAMTNVPMAPFKQGQLPQTPSQYSTNQSQPMFVSTATSPSIHITSAPQSSQHFSKSTQSVTLYSRSPFGGRYGMPENPYNETTVASLMPSQEAHAQYYSTSMPSTIKSFVKPDRMMVSSGKKQSGVGVKCSLNTDCMIGAYCNGNTNPPSCQCLSTHVDVDGHCERVLYPGQIGCHSDLQCTAAYTGTSCVDRICVCPVGFKEVDQTCVSANESITSPPGGSCTDGRVCINGSVCRNGWCVCPDPSMIVQRGICIHSEQRRTSTSVTSKGQTQSTGSHVNIIHAMHGRKIAPGSSCGPLDSCDGGSMCVDGLCVCAAGMKSSTNGLCVPVTTSKPSMSSVLVLNPGTPIYARPRQKCSGGEICVGGSYCNEKGLCTCPPEKPILHGDECTMQQFSGVASPGESCDKNTACTQGSTCDRDAGICMCPPGHTVIGAQCQIPSTHSSVIKPVMTPSFINTTLSSAQKILTPTTPSYMISDCLNDTQCGEHKACVMGRCKCKSGFFDHNGICKPSEGLVLRKLRYGELCQNAKDACTLGAECIDSVCKCGPGLALSTSGWCERFEFKSNVRSRVTLTHSPNNSVITTVFPQHAYTSTTVFPPSNFSTTFESHRENDLASYGKKSDLGTQRTRASPKPKVVRHRFLGTKCRNNDVCINGGECRSGFCQCPEKSFARDGKCLRVDQLPRAKPNESCEKGEMCTGGSICDNDSKTCICSADHLIVNGLCRSKGAVPFSGPGESCVSGENCSGNSFCVSGTCQCDGEHYAEDGYCRHTASRSSPIKYLAGGGLRFSTKVFLPRSPASMCDEATCRLPNCFCSRTGRRPPGGLSPSDIPQFVVLTFDDAVNGRTFPDYLELFEKVKYRNPNGCPIKATFFVSHEWTNYDAVQWLFQQGMEVASNSISHVSLEGASTNRWLNEMEGQRRIMARFANVNEEDIIGMRAPQLALGGDAQFEMMIQASFHYDNSMSVDPGTNTEPFWPQTMDHSVPWDCYDAQCPTRSFPGLWEMPMNQFYGSYLPEIDSFRRSSMLRAAVDLNTTVEQLTNMLFSNFERSYLTNRAPYVLSLNADLLQLNGKNTGMEALQRFLEEVLYKKDVYVVTMRQLLHWMRNPVTLTRVSQADSLKCEQSASSHYPSISKTPCIKSNKCMYQTPGLPSQEHEFLTCSSCPNQYPWFDNTLGN